MAYSRTERIGTIFTRITSLLKGDAISQENLPLWYHVYKAFPPTHEPRFNRSPSQKQIQNIFYKEDVIRAKFQLKTHLEAINLKNENVTDTQILLQLYDCFLEDGLTEGEAYNNARKKYYMLFKKTESNNAKSESVKSHK